MKINGYKSFYFDRESTEFTQNLSVNTGFSRAHWEHKHANMTTIGWYCQLNLIRWSIDVKLGLRLERAIKP